MPRNDEIMCALKVIQSVCNCYSGDDSVQQGCLNCPLSATDGGCNIIRTCPDEWIIRERTKLLCTDI